MADNRQSGWPNASARPSAPDTRPTYGELEKRLGEMEALCRDIYVVAAEIGLPRPLLNRLFVIAGQGAPPQAFALDPAAALAQATTRDAAPEPAAAPAALPPLKRRRTVLIVDDDPLMLEVIGRILSRENYEMIRAASGAEALERLDGVTALDLLIADVAMPEMTGPQLADRVRESFPGVPVLFQTGFSDLLFDERPALDHQSAFLEKPFTRRGLIEAARMVMFDTLKPAE